VEGEGRAGVGVGGEFRSGKELRIMAINWLTVLLTVRLDMTIGDSNPQPWTTRKNLVCLNPTSWTMRVLGQ
jgi:hypothetical protein